MCRRRRLRWHGARVLGEEGLDIGTLHPFQGDVLAPVLAEQRGQCVRIGAVGAERLDQRFGGGVGRGMGLLGGACSNTAAGTS